MYLHEMSKPLRLWQHLRMGGDDVVKRFVPGGYWRSNNAGLKLMNINWSPHDNVIKWSSMTPELWSISKV